MFAPNLVGEGWGKIGWVTADMNENLVAPSKFEIYVEGHISDARADLFEGMAIQRNPDGTTLICGHLPDQTALHSILIRLRDMNIKIISVNTVD